MALFFECMQKSARKLLDTADIVRDRDFASISRSTLSDVPGWRESAKRLAKHALIAMVGGVVGAVVLGKTFEALWTTRRLGSEWYGPDVWLTGLALGFFINRRLLHRAACFVWIPGVVWLLWNAVVDATQWRPAGMSAMTHVRIELFPTSYSDFNECAMSECLGIVVVTWPVLNTIAYSVGAWLGLLSRTDEPVTEDQSMNLTSRLNRVGRLIPKRDSQSVVVEIRVLRQLT